MRRTLNPDEKANFLQDPHPVRPVVPACCSRVGSFCACSHGMRVLLVSVGLGAAAVVLDAQLSRPPKDASSWLCVPGCVGGLSSKDLYSTLVEIHSIPAAAPSIRFELVLPNLLEMN